MSELENLIEYWRIFIICFASNLNDELRLLHKQFIKAPKILDDLFVEFAADKVSRTVYTYKNTSSASCFLSNNDCTANANRKHNEEQCLLSYNIVFNIPIRKNLPENVLNKLQKWVEQYSELQSINHIRASKACPTTNLEMVSPRDLNHHIWCTIKYKEENGSRYLEVHMLN